MKNLKEIILGTKKSSSIDDYIQEKLKINSNSKISKYEYQPKDKDELMKLLDKLIKERGLEGDFNDIDTSKITDMSCLFTFSRPKFNGDISKWDVSNVKDMHFMFSDTKFNQNISNWDVSNVKNMSNMFYGSEFNQNISNWDVSNVDDMAYMIDCSPLEKNPPKWYKE